jgi:hypothetical protein
MACGRSAIRISSSALSLLRSTVLRLWASQASSNQGWPRVLDNSDDDYDEIDQHNNTPCRTQCETGAAPNPRGAPHSVYVYDLCMVVDCSQWRDDMTACVKARFPDAEIRIVSSNSSLSGFCVAIRLRPLISQPRARGGICPWASAVAACASSGGSLLGGGYEVVRSLNQRIGGSTEAACNGNVCSPAASSPRQPLARTPSAWRIAVAARNIFSRIRASPLAQNSLGLMVMCGIIYATHLADVHMRNLFRGGIAGQRRERGHAEL